MAFTKETELYFEQLKKEIDKQYVVAQKARTKGFDPKTEVEAPLALTLAAKVVRLIATKYPQLDNKEVINRILELEKTYGSLDNAVSFKIAEEIMQEKYCTFETQLEAMDAAFRVGFAYTTLGVVSSPIEGFTEIKTGKTKTGETYLKAYFSGPIRSAGTTASCVGIILLDYLRQLAEYAQYDPTEKECKHIVTELYDYHERVTNLQYLPTEEEAYFIAQNCPIQICGDPTEKREVSNYKNLPRIDTDFIRGGLCLVIGEGLAQKAAKALRILISLKENGFKIQGWEWLQEYVTLHEKREKGTVDKGPTYLKDLVAGRPVFGHPNKGFRFRYGRSRVAGFSAVSIHPASMAVTNDFIATGTQLKIEKPTKGCIVTPCESIDGPIVKFSDGSVKKMHDYEETKKKYKEIQEILYLGDVLFPLGDVINRNAPLFSPGYVEEWWEEELKAAKGSVGNAREVDIQTAVTLSEEYSIPLHPSHIFFWTQISYDQFLRCIDWVQHAHIREGKLLLPYNATEKERFHLGKRALELLGVEHQVATEHVVLSKDITQAFLINLGFSLNHTNECIFSINFNEYDDVLKVINILSKVTIKDKAGEFMGSRMGRPEKAKLRKLIGSPNIIFPVGEEGGRFRSVNVALEGGTIKSDFPAYYCDMCKKETIYTLCEVCKKPARQEEEPFKKTRIDLKHYFEQARATLQLLKVHVPPLIKGVRGTSSEHHNIEPLEKGMLRAKYNLCVNKDGTIRYDCTEMPISHFKPKEIEVNIEKLIELGYSTDYQGKKLTTDTQILELKPHDIILPCNEYAGDEKADEVCMNICNFLDDLLEKLYKLPRYYNIKTRTDLVGQLGVCMAPHNCAGVICRIIGFSKVQGLLASPYMHAAMRRDCDGDEAAIMMLLDVLVNFSRKFLPSHRGGTQDAPLVLNGKIYANEVDDQILDFELVNSYPLELYQKAEQKKHSSEINIEMVKQRIARGEDPYVHTGFTHATENVNAGATCSSYKTLPTMKDKVEGQMVLCGKLRSVDEGDVARLIIDRHFMRDLKGNLRKFSQQTFRCVACNTIHRRPPLSGKCEKCKGKIIFTISYGSIVKYLEPALDLSTNFKVPEYIKQDLLLTKKYIESIFGKETEKQESIEKWF